MSINAAVYARYSSHKQNEQSIEGQLTEARRYADMHGYTIVEEYCDRAKTGRTDNRDEFQRMLRDSEGHGFTVLIVWKVDRFGRNREEIIANKVRLKKNGVRVEYIAESLPDTSESVLLESLFEGMAEYYSLQLRQNVIRGMQKSAEKCQSTGGQIAYGYRVDKNKRFIVNEEEASVVKKIYALYISGESVSEIERILAYDGTRNAKGKIFKRQHIRSILNNKKYTGVYCFNGQEKKGGVPAIVSEEDYEKVRYMMKKHLNTPRHKFDDEEYILTGKIFCGLCGETMHGVSGIGKSGTKHSYYACHAHYKNKSCSKKNVRKSTIEKDVIEAARNVLNDDELMNSIATAVADFINGEDISQNEVETLKKRLSDVEKSIDNLTDAVIKFGGTDSIILKLKDLEENKKCILAAYQNAVKNAEEKICKDDIINYLSKIKQGTVSSELFDKALVQTFINSVYVYDDYYKIIINLHEKGEQTKIVDINCDNNPCDGFVTVTEKVTKVQMQEPSIVVIGLNAIITVHSEKDSV